MTGPQQGKRAHLEHEVLSLPHAFQLDSSGFYRIPLNSNGFHQTPLDSMFGGSPYKVSRPDSKGNPLTLRYSTSVAPMHECPRLHTNTYVFEHDHWTPLCSYHQTPTYKHSQSHTNTLCSCHWTPTLAKHLHSLDTLQTECLCTPSCHHTILYIIGSISLLLDTVYISIYCVY